MNTAKQYFNIACMLVLTLCTSLAAKDKAVIQQQVYGQALYERICAIVEETEADAQSGLDYLVQTIIADAAIGKLVSLGEQEGYTFIELLASAKTAAQANGDQEVMQVLQEVQQELSKSWFFKHPIMTMALALGGIYTYVRWESVTRFLDDCLKHLGFRAAETEAERAIRLAAEQEAARLAEEQAARLAEQRAEAERVAAQQKAEAERVAAETEAQRLAAALKQKEQETAAKFENFVAGAAQKAGLTPEQHAELERLVAANREKIITHFNEATQELKKATAQGEIEGLKLFKQLIKEAKKIGHAVVGKIDGALHHKPEHAQPQQKPASEVQGAPKEQAKPKHGHKKDKPKKSIEDIDEVYAEWKADHEQNTPDELGVAPENSVTNVQVTEIVIEENSAGTPESESDMSEERVNKALEKLEDSGDESEEEKSISIAEALGASVSDVTESEVIFTKEVTVVAKLETLKAASLENLAKKKSAAPAQVLEEKSETENTQENSYPSRSFTS